MDSFFLSAGLIVLGVFFYLISREKQRFEIMQKQLRDNFDLNHKNEKHDLIFLNSKQKG